MLLLALALAPQPVDAASPEVWAALHNGRMVAAMEQDPAQAAAIYEGLLDRLTDGLVEGGHWKPGPR